MTTGTGLALLGIWITCAATWHSPYVKGGFAFLMTVFAVALTLFSL